MRKTINKCPSSGSHPHLSRRGFLGLAGAVPMLWSENAMGGVLAPPIRLSLATDTPVGGTDAVNRAVDFCRPPQLSLMVGYIKDPEHSKFSLRQFAETVGKNFDARALATRAKKAGIVDIIWYDKWIDGLVYHKTQTTTFMTGRDFLAELAPECKRVGLKLIVYFNIFFDGNPEFAQWACTDQRGRPIAFPEPWMDNLLSMYSPFREKALQQIHEIMVNYDPDGLWLDNPAFPTLSYDQWTQEAFRKLYGKSMEEASSVERGRFAVDSMTGWLKDVAAYARKIKPNTLITNNSAFEPLNSGPRLAAGMAEPSDYLSRELHTLKLQQEYVPVFSEFEKPAEAGYLISDDWFSPMNAGAVRTMKSEDEVRRALATTLGGGINLYFAIALGHDGTTDEGTLQLLDLAGAWLDKRRPFIENARGFNDVGIVLGAADPEDVSWPGGPHGYGEEILKLEASLRNAGYLPRRLINCAHLQRWDEIPEGMRTLILPDRVNLSAVDREKVRSFVERGGKVLAFGRGAGLRRSETVPQIDNIFGVRAGGYLEPIAWANWSWRLQIEGEGKDINFDAPIILTHPTSAQTVLWADGVIKGSIPCLTVNQVGKGHAYLATVPESAFFDAPSVLDRIWKETIGEPVWKGNGHQGSYTVNFRRQKGRTLIHVVNDLSQRYVMDHRYPPEYVQLQINTDVVPFQTARILPQDQMVQISGGGAWKSLEIYPDPDVTILLE